MLNAMMTMNNDEYDWVIMVMIMVMIMEMIMVMIMIMVTISVGDFSYTDSGETVMTTMIMAMAKHPIDSQYSGSTMFTMLSIVFVFHCLKAFIAWKYVHLLTRSA